jgi:hypothetical protein
MPHRYISRTKRSQRNPHNTNPKEIHYTMVSRGTAVCSKQFSAHAGEKFHGHLAAGHYSSFTSQKNKFCIKPYTASIAHTKD